VFNLSCRQGIPRSEVIDCRDTVSRVDSEVILEPSLLFVDANPSDYPVKHYHSTSTSTALLSPKDYINHTRETGHRLGMKSISRM
jgi:hypothetical protein